MPADNEIFGKRPRLRPEVEALLAFALKDAEAPAEMPPPAPPELLARRDAALRFAALADDDEAHAQLHQAYHHFDVDLESWLAELPGALASAKLADEAIDLARKLDPCLHEYDSEEELAFLLAAAGRRDEALARVEKDLEEGGGAWFVARAGDVLRMLGEKARAQALYRQAQILSSDVGDTIDFIERELPLLDEFGRAEEAKALREALEQLEQANPYADAALDDEDDDAFDDEGDLAPEPIRAEATPARNAPCPCGSGRKYKRCCGKS
jgi:tetratricopeptide (TPR) repeat protein